MSDEDREEVQEPMAKTDDPEVFRMALQIMREQGMHAQLKRLARLDRWPQDTPCSQETGEPQGPAGGER